MTQTTKFKNRRRGSTTEEGYGNTHQKTRRQLFAQLPEWFNCTRCGRPIWKWTKEPDGKGRLRSAVHLDHNPDGTYRGFSCADCNRKAGAHTARVNGNRNRGYQVNDPVQPRRPRYDGPRRIQPGELSHLHRSEDVVYERQCPSCLAIFLATHPRMTFCGPLCRRTIHVEQMRRVHQDRKNRYPNQVCMICGTTFTSRLANQPTCGRRCGLAYAKANANGRRGRANIAVQPSRLW